MYNQEKFNQLINKLSVKEGQQDVYMSNRNFTTLHKLLEAKKIKNNHLAFAYSYLYFQNYMFRYAKYGQYVPQTGEIKEMLGYHSINKTIDYLIKKGGLLDEAGMTVTLFDFPVVQTWNDDQPEFEMLSDFNDMNGYGTDWRKVNKVKTNQSCKYPVYAFYDETTDYQGTLTHNKGGSFFDMTNTTKLDINIFLYCMSNSDLECTGFYLYSFLKWKCDCTEGEIYGIGYERLAEETGLKLSTVKKYVKLLRQYNLISCHSGTYVIFGEGEEINKSDLEPNRYGTNPFEWFLEVKQTDLTKPNYVRNADIQKNKAMEEQIAKEMNRLFG